MEQENSKQEQKKLPKDIQEALDLIKNLNSDSKEVKEESAISLMPGRFIKCPVCGKKAFIVNIKTNDDNHPTEAGYACSNRECNAEGYLPFTSLYDKKGLPLNYPKDPQNKILLGEFLSKELQHICVYEEEKTNNKVESILMSSNIFTLLLFSEDFESNNEVKRIQGEYLAGYLGDKRIKCWVTPFLKPNQFLINEVLYKLINQIPNYPGYSGSN
jgi:hypothetical protein